MIVGLFIFFFILFFIAAIYQGVIYSLYYYSTGNETPYEMGKRFAREHKILIVIVSLLGALTLTFLFA